MGTRRPARLYQKKSGIFFIRILLGPSKLGLAENGQTKQELRRSLGTKSLTVARSISSYMNALLERVPLNERAAHVNTHLRHAINTWTLPGGISASDDDDQERLIRFLEKKPEIEQAILDQMKARARYLNSLADQAERITSASAIMLPGQQPQQFIPTPAQYAMSMPAPAYTMRMASACRAYRNRYGKELATQTDRTAHDKGRLLELLVEYLRRSHPELGDDPLVHLIDTPHLRGFMNEQQTRRGKRKAADGEGQAGAAPLTLIKKLSDLNHFFDFLVDVEKVALSNPVHGLKDAREAWQAQASAEGFHYSPFRESEIAAIFKPEHYLTRTRDPDHFWCPLLGAHLGCRLGEIVNRKVSDIGYIKEVDIWYIDVPDESAKNSNSVRRLPVTQPLIDLGFIEYVKHVRRLGAEYLFPNRDWTSPTSLKDPSKTQSVRFGANLDVIGLTSPKLVFHSFRHTVVNVLHDAGVPLSHAMQICGHEAQEHALRKGTLTEQQARSVHHTTYTQSDTARLGTEHPIVPLKEALERAVILPLDYPRLRKASELVQEHTRKIGGEFRTGWPAQRQRYTEEVLARLAG